MTVTAPRARAAETIGWHMAFELRKYAGDIDAAPDREAFLAADPEEILTGEHNLLLNEGITRLLNLLTGTTTNPYNNANARIGVGNSTTAAAATQTALQGGSTLFKAMDATYPQVSGQTVTFRATFGGTDANFAWEEFSIDNGSTPNENLNRKVQALGTKSSGSTWVLTVTITIS